MYLYIWKLIKKKHYHCKKLMSKFYSVKKGRKTGVFRSWNETKKHVHGYPGAIYKSFKNENDALIFLKGKENCETMDLKECENVIYCYTDGGSRTIDGKKIAGIGIYIPNINISISKRLPLELKQTNNVAELVALLKCFKIIEDYKFNTNECKKYVIYSDSEYSMKSILGIYNGYKNKEIIDYCRLKYSELKSFVSIRHIYAHTGNNDKHSIGNEKADELATKAIVQKMDILQNIF